VKTNLPLPLVAIFLIIISPLSSRAIDLPKLFSDHMVLQSGASVPIWGNAKPGESVSVSIKEQTKETIAGPDGKWMVKLENLQTGSPEILTIKGSTDTVTIKDVLIGEVWLASGQSNMGFLVSRLKNVEEEKAEANFPQIRVFNSGLDQSQGHWQVCTPETVSTFSAAAYFFGRNLHKTLQIPVGILTAAVGGTAIELWISAEAQKNNPQLKEPCELFAQRIDSAKVDQNELGKLFQTRIAPLIPYAIRGAIWYQGEFNTRPAVAQFYGAQLQTLIKDWRGRWNEGDFPFAWVQLPNFESSDRNFPIVREGMLKTLQLPNTGMAVTIDIGESNNLHPQDKQDVGKRLALWALSSVYGKSNAPSGPLFKDCSINGNEVVISFDHTEGGLKSKDPVLKGFQLAGDNKVWKTGNARIDGDKVKVVSSEVEHPVAVRYAWASNPPCSLYNGEGLPASPFRTDDWNDFVAVKTGKKTED
jgi:sialate O-acetylesterase